MADALASQTENVAYFFEGFAPLVGNIEHAALFEVFNVAVEVDFYGAGYRIKSDVSMKFAGYERARAGGVDTVGARPRALDFEKPGLKESGRRVRL